MPQNGLMYRESLVRIFKACGKGKKLHFEGSRYKTFRFQFTVVGHSHC